MHAQTAAMTNGTGRSARARTYVDSAVLPVLNPWQHHVCIFGKTGIGTRRLGEHSP